MLGNEQLAIIIPELREIGERIDPSQLHRPTPCTDFTVAGVLGHMTGLASAFAPIFRGEEPPSSVAESDDTTELARFDAAMVALLDAVQPPDHATAIERLVAFSGRTGLTSNNAGTERPVTA